MKNENTNTTGTNNYFAAKAAMKKINANIKAKHPDWDSKKVYMMTKSIYASRQAAAAKEAEAPAEEAVAEAPAEA